MIVLALAAAASAAVVSAPPPPPAAPCAPPQTALTSQHAPLRAQKLGDLPDAEMDLAVVRSVDGCWVREVVRFKVSGGDAAGRAVAPPTPGYAGKLVPDGPVVTTPTAR